MPRLARWMQALGVITTVAANVLYGLRGGAYDALVSAWPAISFLGCVEMLMYLLRVSRTRRVPATRSAAVPVVVPLREPAPVPQSVLAVPLETEFAAEIASGKVPGVKAIQRRMGGGQPAAYKHQAQLARLVQARAAG